LSQINVDENNEIDESLGEQKEGSAWRIQDKKLDKNSGVYKYCFECRHAGTFKSKKKTKNEPSQQCNRNHTLNPDNAHFINIYRQIPQNIMDKIGFYVNTVHGISQHTLNKDLANVIQHFRKGDVTDPERDPENDASNLLKALRTLKEDDPTWFIAGCCVKNRLFHLFWMTPHQKSLYLRHHDVILTDNTAQTNKY
ncbi:7627_t:CDS:2, partial [Gigaspora margarita]